jgi:hypothetical protein
MFELSKNVFFILQEICSSFLQYNWVKSFMLDAVWKFAFYIYSDRLLPSAQVPRPIPNTPPKVPLAIQYIRPPTCTHTRSVPQPPTTT